MNSTSFNNILDFRTFWTSNPIQYRRQCRYVATKLLFRVVKRFLEWHDKVDTSSSQSKTSHLSSAMVNLYINMGKLRNSFYEIKYTETFSVQMTHKNSQNDDNGDFITLVRSEEDIDCTCAYKICWCALVFNAPTKGALSFRVFQFRVCMGQHTQGWLWNDLKVEITELETNETLEIDPVIKLVILVKIRVPWTPKLSSSREKIGTTTRPMDDTKITCRDMSPWPKIIIR